MNMITLCTRSTFLVVSGEFGVVYKARLQWHPDAMTEIVAVKTLKGKYF